MIGYDRFSALRLRYVFPPAVLAAARFYIEAPDEGPDSFDEEYMGGLWSSEVIDGVSLWFPARAPSKVGIVQVSGGPRPDAVAVGRQPFVGPFLDPAWTANANQVLATLGLALRIGDAEGAVGPLAARSIRRTDFRADEARRFISFAMRAPELYHVHGIVHDQEGLLHLEIRRPDLIRANESESGGYDECDGSFFDEGPAA